MFIVSHEDDDDDDENFEDMTVLNFWVEALEKQGLTHGNFSVQENCDIPLIIFLEFENNVTWAGMDRSNSTLRCVLRKIGSEINSGRRIEQVLLTGDQNEVETDDGNIFCAIPVELIRSF